MSARWKPLWVAAGLALGVASTTALAQEARWLVGLGIGYQKSEDVCPGAAAAVGTCEEKGTTWKIFGGYQFNPYLGVELGFIDLGDRPAFVSGLGAASAQFRIFETLLVATLPVSERFAFYGKAGVYQWDADFEFNPPVAGSADANGKDYTFGLGVRFNLTRNAALRLEWQRYNDVGDPATTGRFNVDVFGLSALISF
jgi:OOP family OmpA-OmpF porin